MIVYMKTDDLALIFVYLNLNFSKLGLFRISLKKKLIILLNNKIIFFGAKK